MHDVERVGGHQTLCLVVPMFNEEERVGESLEPLLDFVSSRPAPCDLIFVDDGSTDQTIDVVRAGIKRHGTDNATLLRRPHAGKGAAIRAGLLAAKAEMAAFCDVDLATPLAELDRIIDVATSDSCLAIGSRAAPDATIRQHETRRREVAGKAFNRLVRTGLCGGVADTQCGAKAAPSWVWQAILPFSREDGFAWDVEVIASARRLRIPVREVGVEWNHDERTRVRVFRDGMLMVLAVPRIGLNVRRIRPTPGLEWAPLPVSQPAPGWGALPPADETGVI